MWRRAAALLPDSNLQLCRRFKEQAGGKAMSDDKSKVGRQDRSRVSAEEPYEVEYFARKHGISQQEAREIIEKHGPSRAACDRAASAAHA
jgi:hypothetical protein